MARDLDQTRSWRNQEGLEAISSAPKRVVQNMMTGVWSFLASRLTCSQKATRSILMSHAHPELEGPLVLRPNGVAPFCCVRHPYGRSHTKQSIDLEGRFFIFSRQSPCRRSGPVMMGDGVMPKKEARDDFIIDRRDLDRSVAPSRPLDQKRIRFENQNGSGIGLRNG